MEDKENLIFKKALLRMIIDKNVTLNDALYYAVYKVLSANEIKALITSFDIDIPQYVNSLEQRLMNFISN